MNVQDLKPFECVRLTEGTGGSKMHVIKGKGKEIYVTCDDKVKRLDPDPSDENEKYVYNNFLNSNGEKTDTITVIKDIRISSHDWWSLLLCEMIYNDMNNEED